MAVIRWDNVGISNNNSGTGATAAGIRGWEGTTDSILDLTDRVKESKTDQALAAMSADGVLSRDEIGQVGPGVDMKTILDAQRLDQNSREATETGKLSNALTEQQRVKAARENSPEALARAIKMEDAKLEVEKSNAAASNARAETAAAQLGITKDKWDLAKQDRTKTEAIETAFLGGMSEHVNKHLTDPDSQWGKETVVNDQIEAFKKKTSRDPTDEEITAIRQAYDKELPNLTERLQQQYTRVWMNNPKNAPNAKYLTEVPMLQQFAASQTATAQAEAEKQLEINKAIKRVMQAETKTPGGHVTFANGKWDLSETDLTLKNSKEKTDYSTSALAQYALIPGETAASVSRNNPDTDTDQVTNADGMNQLLKITNHPEIIQDVLASNVHKTTGWRWGAPEVWADWGTMYKEARIKAQDYANKSPELQEQKFGNVDSATNALFGNLELPTK